MSKQPKEKDPEFEALRKCVNALNGLSSNQQRRVVNFFYSRVSDEDRPALKVPCASGEPKNETDPIFIHPNA
jgi:hypothetical protein